jgi:outer membrane receptor for ferrienterochelin and colicins
MKHLKFAAAFVLLLTSFFGFAQQPQGPKVKVTGTVLEKVTRQPLEYATVTFFAPNNPKVVAGGITNNKGEFDIDVPGGTYDIKVEFISFQATTLAQKNITQNTNLGVVELAEDATQLNEVVVRSEKTTVEIKLDKKVYNVGNDIMVKGGTVSDVLDNIPSVSVSAEGVISLRGNENVRILIDGRPSNAISVTEALRLIPADAIEKVEVVTNPSARYDSEGGGGLLNIILKKGKNQGLNGTVIAKGGDPDNYGLSANVNFKTKEFNLFTTTGYNYRTGPGYGIVNTEYLNDDNTTRNFVNERRDNNRLNKGYNSNFGMDWFLSPSTTWTNSMNLRRNSGNNPELVKYDNYDAAGNYLYSTSRFNYQVSESENAEYSTNLIHNFKKEGHKLTIDGAFSQNKDNDSSEINDGLETTANDQKQNRNVIKTDYILPLGKGSQFEAGYKGEFNDLLTDYRVDTLDVPNNVYNPDLRYTNTLEYKEKINALYTTYGTKIKKFSVLLGMRWEDSNIDINQLATNDYNKKRYNNFFPSAFFTYEFTDESSASISYSKRISRPRGRQNNPISKI